MLEYDEYSEAILRLRPDIVVGMADVLFGHTPGVKRKDVMGDRTLAWVKRLINDMKDDEEGIPSTVLFAPILPIEAEQQSYYVETIENDLKESVAGLALYDIASVDAIPKGLRQLPRLFLGEAKSPHNLLAAVALGIDLFTIPFITEATDAGIALDFSLPPAEINDDNTPLGLGIDMWSTDHAIDMLPIRMECECYTCKNHSRAFIQHLLNAKEMLAWVLLQIHNHHVIDRFFTGIRRSILHGSFEVERQAFERSYVIDLPAKTGQGPR